MKIDLDDLTTVWHLIHVCFPEKKYKDSFTHIVNRINNQNYTELTKKELIKLLQNDITSI